MKPYLVLAYYHFTHLADPLGEVGEHQKFFEGKNVTSRIYISEQGINGQMSAIRADAEAYMEWIHSKPHFKSLSFKIDEWHEHVFPRLTVKYRKHLVAYNQPVDLNARGTPVSPEQWKEMLNNRTDSLLIDTRNDYEWKLGRFKGASLPPCKTFREFEAYAENLKKEHDPKTPIMMYCTGGIRCELYSSILIKNGFTEVYQLEGGIINYGKKVGADHWLGKLFVFDDRLSVPISEEENPIIGECHHCRLPSEAYYNCANMDCNELFICCPECLKEFAGCCQKTCQNAERLRPYHQLNPHKPFRRKHLCDTCS